MRLEGANTSSDRSSDLGHALSHVGISIHADSPVRSSFAEQVAAVGLKIALVEQVADSIHDGDYLLDKAQALPELEPLSRQI